MPVLKVKNGGTWINVSGGSGSSVQADWNINDEANAAYIKNRPFYEEHNVWVSLLPSTEFGPFEFDDTFNAYMYQAPATFKPVVGNTYKITWDSIEYECVAQDANAVMSGAIAIGNASAFGLAGNDEPFVIAYRNLYMGYMSYTEGNHTVAIEEIGTVIHKIDGKYLPDGIGYIGTENIEIVPKQIIEGFTIMEEPIYAVSISVVLEPILGSEYVVSWDGVEYTVPCTEASGLLYLGNANYVNMQSGGNIPFAVIFDDSEIYFATESTEGSHTISLSGEVKVAYKMDEDCLPEDVAFLDNIPELPSQIVNSVNGMTGDVIIDIGGGGGVTSWNDLEDKPFVPAVVYYEWDEEIVYDTTIQIPNQSPPDLAKISDDIPESSDFFIGKTLSAIISTGTDTSELQSIEITSRYITQLTEGAYLVGDIVGCFVIPVESYDLGLALGQEAGVLVLSHGVWALNNYPTDSATASSWKIYTPAVQLDESVIPDSIARVTQIPKFSYEYSTEDLIPGVSELETGKLYLVYE